jgi:asparagine synthase (glutamine-hydrolysing)
MCGIAGIYNFNGQAVTIPDLKKMTDAIRHRGPDGEGQWINSNRTLGFGHRRLSIIDLSENGKQPMHYSDGRYTITFNGEIYNYIELKRELQDNKYQFRSGSDTEVLMAMYDKYREECLHYLDGMFAFAIWDEIEKTLFCARDRFGEKPFYYFLDKERFVFASEMKALWQLDIRREPDEAMFNDYINYNIVSSEDASRTFYKNIHQLPASYCLMIGRNHGIKKVRYYSLDNIVINKEISFQTAAERFRELLSESIRLRLRSDVPVGSSLSGGLDSSAIVTLIDKIKGESQVQKTFSARFNNFKKDEGRYIELVVKNCRNVVNEYTWPDAEQFLSDIEKLSYHQEEPFASSSIYAQYKVMGLAHQHGVTVLLDGQGADEQLAGYLAYYRLYLNQLFYHNTDSYPKAYNAYFKNHNDQHPAIDLMKDETLRMKLGKWKRKIFDQPLPVEKNALKRALLADMQNGGLKNLLRYADRNSMAHSREIRLPFLSHHLVEFVFSLPDEFILNEGWTKYVMRKAMESELPPEITWRVDKTGYEAPEQTWMSHPEVGKKVTELRKNYSELIQKREISDWQVLMLGSYYN